MDDLVTWALARFCDTPPRPYPKRPPEAGIPIPPRGIRVRGDKGQAICRMAIGESILCDTPKEANTVKGTIRQLGGKSQTRKSREGWRVWRVE